MLEARGVCVAPPGWSGPAPVREFSLRLDRGEWISLTGPNGCGKSTLALALAGLRPIQSGVIEIDGVRLGHGADDQVRASVGAVLQEPASQLFQATVAEELTFASRNLGRNTGMVAHDVRRWVERLGLEEELDRDPHALSAGRQQLVLIAAALIAGPRVLILDEATAHVDDRTRERLLDGIREEVDAGLAVVWITQVAREHRAADRTVRLNQTSRSGAPASGPAPDETRRPHAAEADRSVEGEPAARIDIAPWDGNQGPHVEIHGRWAMEIPARGITALEGRNGVGKSVVLDAVAGVRSVAQVRVTFFAHTIGAPILAGQYPELQLFEERVADEVAYGAVSRGMARSAVLTRAAQCFDALGLGAGAFLDRRTWELSAGEKRLTEVIAALIAPASVVLLDEPTCGLDSERRQALASLVMRRGKLGPILIATQDRAWVEQMEAQPRFLDSDGADEATHSKKTD